VSSRRNWSKFWLRPLTSDWFVTVEVVEGVEVVLDTAVI
jgi:hypothetical protein